MVCGQKLPLMSFFPQSLGQAAGIRAPERANGAMGIACIYTPLPANSCSRYRGICCRLSQCLPSNNL